MVVMLEIDRQTDRYHAHVTQGLQLDTNLHSSDDLVMGGRNFDANVIKIFPNVPELQYTFYHPLVLG